MNARAPATTTARGSAVFIPLPAQATRVPMPEPVPVPQPATPQGPPPPGRHAGAHLPGRTDARTPLYSELATQWTARGATVPGAPDPEWQRLVSYESLLAEVESVLSDLRPHRAPQTRLLPARQHRAPDM
ncbi:hypothetical protein [Streptomyces sp. NBC_00388]|uniref:hypothetical protein n=1 Tax=Streptomyces sp. NBC_00388 TaxID=2975735 RepID=UPI002E2280A8